MKSALLLLGLMASCSGSDRAQPVSMTALIKQMEASGWQLDGPVPLEWQDSVTSRMVGNQETIFAQAACVRYSYVVTYVSPEIAAGTSRELVLSYKESSQERITFKRTEDGKTIDDLVSQTPIAHVGKESAGCREIFPVKAAQPTKIVHLQRKLEIVHGGSVVYRGYQNAYALITFVKPAGCVSGIVPALSASVEQTTKTETRNKIHVMMIAADETARSADSGVEKFSVQDARPGANGKGAAGVYVTDSELQKAYLRERARKQYEAVLDLDPRYWQAYQGLMHVHLKSGEFDLALDAIHKALEIAPGNMGLLCDQARCHSCRKEWTRAENSLRSALKIDPHNRDVRKQLGFTLARSGKFEEAAEILCSVYHKVPGQGYFEVAMMIHQNLGQEQQCMEYLRRAVRANPNLESALTMLRDLEHAGNQQIRPSSAVVDSPSSARKNTEETAKKGEPYAKLYFLQIELGGEEVGEALSAEFVDWLMKKIPQVVRPGTWNNNPGFVELAPIARPAFFVYQTPEGHAAVSAFLKSMRGSFEDFLRSSRPGRRRPTPK